MTCHILRYIIASPDTKKIIIVSDLGFKRNMAIVDSDDIATILRKVNDLEWKQGNSGHIRWINNDEILKIIPSEDRYYYQTINIYNNNGEFKNCRNIYKYRQPYAGHHAIYCNNNTVIRNDQLLAR